MKSLKTLTVKILAICALAGACVSANAVTYDVNPASPWIGYMNVFEHPVIVGALPYPAGLGPRLWGSAWGTADLNSSWGGGMLTLSPNTIGDTNTYWYFGGGAPGNPGAKIMGANLYVEVGSLPGQTVTFSGTVLANTLFGKTDPLGNGWTSVAFIKDFAPDYSSFVSTTVPLTPGPFSITLNTINDPARHVQYGFETMGADVWYTDVAQYGDIQIMAVPEPGTLALVGLGLILPALLRRRQ